MAALVGGLMEALAGIGGGGQGTVFAMPEAMLRMMMAGGGPGTMQISFVIRGDGPGPQADVGQLEPPAPGNDNPMQTDEQNADRDGTEDGDAGPGTEE